MRRRVPIPRPLSSPLRARRLAATVLAAAVAVAPAWPAAPASAATSPPEPRPLIDDTEPRVTVALSPSELTVGDRVDAVLTVSAPEARLVGAPRFPDWATHWGSAEILEVSSPETLEPRAGVATFRQKLVLTAFRPGEVALPPQEVEVPFSRGSVRISTPAELGFEISPVLPPPAEEGPRDGVEDGVPTAEDEDATEPGRRPEEPLRSLPLTPAFWATAGLLGAACVALAFLLWGRIRTPEIRSEDLTPLVRLERDLEALPSHPSLVDAHARLSRALRRYLGRELAFPAAESTTTEIRRALAVRRVPEAVHRDADEVLTACDLVKFARRETRPEVLRQRVGTVRRLGRELDVHLHPPEPHPPSPEEGAP